MNLITLRKAVNSTLRNFTYLVMSYKFAISCCEYVYGRPVTVQSDHKPLAAISNKPLRSAPKRLQGMLMKVQKYDVSIVYKPGPEMYLTDTLSRAFLPNTDNAQREFERVNAVRLLSMTDERLEEMRTGKRDDDVLQQLKEVIQTGWPEEK